jgi:hypothetical protein
MGRLKDFARYKGRTKHPDNPMPLKFWSFFKLVQNEKWFEKRGGLPMD